MKCPVCTDVDLMIAERQGVEIDYCPQCRGVWLDRGELDKIIGRSYASADAPHFRENNGHAPDGRSSREYGGHHGHDEEHHDFRGYYRDKHQKRKSLWKELFDF